ncbi:MAG: hypothetical protein EOO28_30870 [Comamonadaceae bacterium]|nr:MAG: hypothetical protein EOO28_30870 [Comamonadaceae bacterium]
MGFMNWFSGKAAAAEKARALPAPRAPADAAHRGEERKVVRHARREQLYVAVRESMTRAGVLSAMYKFKVLSLDQAGNQFLVMMDLGQASSNQPEKLGEIETAIMQLAKARFEITVTAVYWRFDAQVAVGRPPAAVDAARKASLAAALARSARAPEEAGQTDRPPSSSRPYEPIQPEEVAAFKRALATANAANAAPAARPGPDGQVRSGPRSYTLLTGFEDTEMTESPTLPSLSTTQYGDLN